MQTFAFDRQQNVGNHTQLMPMNLRHVTATSQICTVNYGRIQQLIAVIQLIYVVFGFRTEQRTP